MLKARKAIKSFLNKERINELAKSIGFVKRIRKITPFEFFCLLGTREAPESLRSYSSRLGQDHSVKIRRQSLDKKFTPKGVEFLKSLLAEAIEMLFDGGDGDDKICIKLKDSTGFQCPESMSAGFKGCGGDGSAAGIKVQNEYDLNSNIYEMSVGAMAVPDNKNVVEGNKHLKAGDLSIRDLGYVTMDAIEDLTQRGVFYVYRLNGCNVYTKEEGEYVALDFKELYKKIEQTGKIDLEVYLGPKKRQTRLVADVVPQDVYDQRIRKRRKEAKKKGRTLCEDNQYRQNFNLFITNTDISAEDVRKVYRLRWQVELAFKGWKSFENIAITGEVKQERVLMELYAKLIWIAVKTRLEHAAVKWGRSNDFPVSTSNIRNEFARYSYMLWDSGKVCINKIIANWRNNLPNIKRETKKVDEVKYDWEQMLKKLEEVGIRKFLFS